MRVIILFSIVFLSCNDNNYPRLNKEAEDVFQKEMNRMDSLNKDLDKHINELQLKKAKIKLKEGA